MLFLSPRRGGYRGMPPHPDMESPECSEAGLTAAFYATQSAMADSDSARKRALTETAPEPRDGHRQCFF